MPMSRREPSAPYIPLTDEEGTDEEGTDEEGRLPGLSYPASTCGTSEDMRRFVPGESMSPGEVERICQCCQAQKAIVTRAAGPECCSATDSLAARSRCAR